MESKKTIYANEKYKCNIMPIEVEDVLNCEVRIAECDIRNSICGKYEDYAILGYCFSEAIRSENLKRDISRNLQEMLFNLRSLENEIYSYNSYDYGTITNVTITNNIYAPVVGGIANEKE